VTRTVRRWELPPRRCGRARRRRVEPGRDVAASGEVRRRVVPVTVDRLEQRPDRREVFSAFDAPARSVVGDHVRIL
jgi:hypothetical protein